jgi:hypothetical protein
MSVLRTVCFVANVVDTAGSHNTNDSQISAAANARQSQCGGNLSDVARMLRRSWRGEAVYMSSHIARLHILDNINLNEQHITNGTIWTHSSLHWVRSRIVQRFVLVSPIFVEVGMWEVILVHALKTYGGVEVWLHSFLTSAPNSVSGQSYASADFPAKEITQFQLNRGLAGRLSARLGGVKINILPFPGIRPYWQCELYNRCTYTRCTL